MNQLRLVASAATALGVSGAIRGALTPNSLDRKVSYFYWDPSRISLFAFPLKTLSKSRSWGKVARLRSCKANRTTSLDIRPKMRLSSLWSRQPAMASPRRHSFALWDGSDKPRAPRGPRRHQRRPGAADIEFDRSQKCLIFTWIHLEFHYSRFH